MNYLKKKITCRTHLKSFYVFKNGIFSIDKKILERNKITCKHNTLVNCGNTSIIWKNVTYCTQNISM